MTQQNNQPPEKAPDEGREPEFVQSLPGRMVSVKGLVERIKQQFYDEHGDGQSDAFQQADTEAKRRGLVRDVTEYVLGVESVQLGRSERATLIARACSEIFSYGPLDELLRDERVTTIALEGTEKVAVRYGPAASLQPLDPLFDDTPHMTQILKRLLRDAGTELRRDVPVIEAGLTVNDRRVCVSLVVPPFVSELAADIRVHPEDAPTLDDLISDNFLNEKAAQLLKAIVQSEAGFMIVGDTESAKTTLLSALLMHLPQPDTALAVERAAELALPAALERVSVMWPRDDDPGITFAERVQNALDDPPQCLILDEVRADEPQAIAPLLRDADMPRLIWSVRGSADPRRIRSSLGMLARMADSTQPEAMVYNLYERLPFMLIVQRRRGTLQLREIAEWQFPAGYKDVDDFVYADYTPLMTLQQGELTVSGTSPAHDLPLPDDFSWNPPG
jgi:Flp pilus assembly CpaF family ATPase